MANDPHPLHVAIIGGGLCGLTLAIALEQRKIDYTLYEARGSFTEIGAGLNMAPNAMRTFNAIDAQLYEKITALATRNEAGREDVWMDYRLGAPTNSLEDGHLVGELRAPPTGNMTFSRNEILQLLAHSVPENRTRFNKKLTDVSQTSNEVTLVFADGTTAVASIAVGCDGAHSAIRAAVLGTDSPARHPTFSHTGGYRAVFSKAVHEQVVGPEKAHTSQLLCGPRGYVIMYPINGGRNVNIGVWMSKNEPWTEKSWVLKNQKAQMLEDLKDWGDTAHRIMNVMSNETEFWASFHHAVRPEHYFDGRICFIGDAAHSMPPHQGQGASQAMEDVCVMATVLQRLHQLGTPTSEHIKASFLGFEAARKERFEAVAQTSHEAHAFWASIWRPDLTAKDLHDVHTKAYKRLTWLWDDDIAGQQRLAVEEMDRLLGQSTKSPPNGDLSAP